MQSIRAIIEQVAAGSLTTDEADQQLHQMVCQPLGFATLDHHRAARCGVPEVVYAAGKHPEQLVQITEQLMARSGHALVTRATEQHIAALTEAFDTIELGNRGQTALVGRPPDPGGTPLPIISAGTSDEPVAEEAELTCRALGQASHRINDVGVAGLHRLLGRLDELQQAHAIVCIAGMEGALPSVLGGLVRVPVIAVPTSVGYGAAMGGLAALLGMLTSCAAGVSVVNIDNGFGGAYTATLIQRIGDQRHAPA